MNCQIKRLCLLWAFSPRTTMMTVTKGLNTSPIHQRNDIEVLCSGLMSKPLTLINLNKKIIPACRDFIGSAVMMSACLHKQTPAQKQTYFIRPHRKSQSAALGFQKMPLEYFYCITSHPLALYCIYTFLQISTLTISSIRFKFTFRTCSS